MLSSALALIHWKKVKHADQLPLKFLVFQKTNKKTKIVAQMPFQLYVGCYTWDKKNSLKAALT